MFTPHSYRIGDHVKITCDLESSEGTYVAGHEFEIISIHFHGENSTYDLRDRNQHLLGNVPFDCISWDHGDAERS